MKKKLSKYAIAMVLLLICFFVINTKKTKTEEILSTEIKPTTKLTTSQNTRNRTPTNSNDAIKPHQRTLKQITNNNVKLLSEKFDISSAESILNYVNSLPIGEKRDEEISKIASFIIGDNPHIFFDNIEAFTDSLTSYQISMFLPALYQSPTVNELSAADIINVLDRSDKLTSQFKESLLAGVFREKLKTSAIAATELLSQIPPQQSYGILNKNIDAITKKMTSEQILKVLKLDEKAFVKEKFEILGAYEALTGIEPRNIQDNQEWASYYEAYLEETASKDLNKGVALLSKLPPSASKDRIIINLVPVIGQYDKASAALWIMEISDIKQREALARMLKLDR